MPKCDFIEITLRYGCSPVNLLHIFRAPFSKNTSGWLLLISCNVIQRIFPDIMNYKDHHIFYMKRF